MTIKFALAAAALLMAAPVWDADTLSDLGDVMTDASICGLGQAAPNAFRTVQRYFSEELAPPEAPSALPPGGDPSGPAEPVPRRPLGGAGLETA